MSEPQGIAGTVTTDHAIVGCSDLSASVTFFEAQGFTELGRHSVDATAAAALYGLAADTEQIVMGVPGATSGLIRLVATPLAAPDRGDFHRGGHALDVYSTNVSNSCAASTAAGYTTGTMADYRFGPVQLQQAQTLGPDEIPLVFVGIDHRLPSVLDSQPERLHSELHSMVATVDDIDAETTFWTAVVGLQLKSRFPIDVPAVSEFMMLPRHAPITMSVMTGPEAAPPRFELMAFTEAPGALVSGRPLVPGALAIGVRVEDVAAAATVLASAGATVHPVVTAPGLDGYPEAAAWATSPAGADMELRGPLPS